MSDELRASTESFLSGLPVDVDPQLIDRELARLWKPAAAAEGARGAVVRACLFNLVAYAPSAAGERLASKVLDRVAHAQPNRTILLATRPDAPSGKLSSTLQAVCHIRARGATPVCGEHIALVARRGEEERFTGAVSPLLVPDLPVIAWWLASTDDPLLARVSRSTDRLVIASCQAGLAAVDDFLADHRTFEVDDIAWRRTTSWRRVIAEVFEEPGVAALAPSIEHVTVTTGDASDGCVPAALLLGGILSQLGVRIDRVDLDRDAVRARGRAGARPITGILRRSPDGGAPIHSLRFETKDREHWLAIETTNDEGTCARIAYHTPDRCRLPDIIGLARRDEIEDAARALTTRGTNEAFRRAVGVGRRIELAARSLVADRAGPSRFVTLADARAVARRAAETLEHLALRSPDRPIAVALSGGSTPLRLFELLAARYAHRIDWSRVEIFFGDERSVPPDHADSNYRAAKNALLDRVRISPDRIHRMEAEAEDLASSASEYEAILAERLPTSADGAPIFDLVWLGMGDDGHTASLFPKTRALEETTAFVAANDVPQLGTRRLTLTYPTLAAARHVQFLVTGASKAARVAQVREALARSPRPDDPPSACVRPGTGTLEWVLDRDAAGGV